MYHIAFHVPSTHVDKVKTALFEAGAGRMGHYGCCAWQTRGQGQFMPLSGSSPFIGVTDALSTVEEYKVELVCEDHLLARVLQTLVDVHPYETPSYHAYPIITLDNISAIE